MFFNRIPIESSRICHQNTMHPCRKFLTAIFSVIVYSWSNSHTHGFWSNKMMYFFSGGSRGRQVGATALLSGRELGLKPPFSVTSAPLVLTQRHSFVIVSIRMWGKHANQEDI